MAHRSALCKPCHRAYTRKHYQDNKQYYVDKARRNNDKVRDLVQKMKEVPCKDCGKSYPYYAMDFDHLSDKKFNISEVMHRKGLSTLLEEIAKCDVICAICHRTRTHLRAQAAIG